MGAGYGILEEGRCLDVAYHSCMDGLTHLERARVRRYSGGNEG